ncbi:hypothetical protein M427DRAFT_132320 [Gonapodya prolifera JEL478]|uniref:Uncharacterized protein n=1 Tax=Gonapodya prolifera (strain JEL478) TaxID=1344416 RepID=A0A139ARL1_GONPJ|nr:hypothetical protein M427DRAFT_132320 [Gonapodya prolifera JEL478]|eukprot:KXS19339.1 hypothetical protein M427DRAFT_132320 [Gonapodya prolifera JEL478]
MATRMLPMRLTREPLDKENSHSGIDGIARTSAKDGALESKWTARAGAGKPPMQKKGGIVPKNATRKLDAKEKGPIASRSENAVPGPQQSKFAASKKPLSSSSVLKPSGKPVKSVSVSNVPAVTPGARALLRDITNKTPVSRSVTGKPSAIPPSAVPKTGLKLSTKLAVLPDEQYSTPTEKGAGFGKGKVSLRGGMKEQLTGLKREVTSTAVKQSQTDGVMGGKAEQQKLKILANDVDSGHRDDGIPDILRRIGFTSDDAFEVEGGTPREVFDEPFIPDPDTIIDVSLLLKPEPPPEWFQPQLAARILNPPIPIFDRREAAPIWLDAGD